MSKLLIHCNAILCDAVVEIETPAGWMQRNDTLDFGEDSSYLFCPDHVNQGLWFDAQCSGCVAGFPDCGLGRSFGYALKDQITNAQLATIESGICPFRVNGSFMFSRDTGFVSDDLSDRATTEGGMDVADAIRQYLAKYPARY